MTDRIKGCWVAFDQDYRDDDSEQILHAILQLKGVIDVAPVKVAGEDFLVRMRLKRELKDKLYKVLED